MDVAAFMSRGARVGCHGIFNYGPGKSTGFTLLELVISVAVMLVVFSIGIPSFHHFTASNRISTHINRLVGTLALSRSEAIKRGLPITLCQSQNNQLCESDGNWSNGWMMFIDTNNNKSLDTAEKLLYTGQKLSGSTNITFNGGFGIDGYIIYRADGSAFPNGTFTVCLEKYQELAKALILFRTGRLRLSKKTAKNTPISCS